MRTFGFEGVDEKDMPHFDSADVGNRWIYSNQNTNNTEKKVHIVTYFLSTYQGKYASMNGEMFDATSPIGEWEKCRPLVRKVLASLELENN